MTDAILDVRRLTKRFGGLSVTERLDLEIWPGEMHALIGPNGAGKTTLIAQLAGTLRSDSGSIVFAGKDITRLPVYQRARLGLGRSFQISSFFPQSTVLQNVALAVQARSGSSYRFWRSLTCETEILDEAASIIREVGLEKMSGVTAKLLSHGEHRQLELAFALAMQPRLLLLDEPMAGMGGEESRNMLALLERLKGRFTVVLVEHDMNAVFRLADRISVLVSGQIIATGTPLEISRNHEVQSAYLGDDEIDALSSETAT